MELVALPRALPPLELERRARLPMQLQQPLEQLHLRPPDLAHQVAALEAVYGDLPDDLVEGDREEELRIVEHLLLIHHRPATHAAHAANAAAQAARTAARAAEAGAGAACAVRGGLLLAGLRLLEARNHVIDPRVQQQHVAPPGGHLARKEYRLELPRRRVVRPVVILVKERVKVWLARGERRLDHDAESVRDDRGGHVRRVRRRHAIRQVRHLALLAAAPCAAADVDLAWQAHGRRLGHLAPLGTALVHVVALLEKIAHLLVAHLCCVRRAAILRAALRRWVRPRVRIARARPLEQPRHLALEALKQRWEALLDRVEPERRARRQRREIERRTHAALRSSERKPS